MKKSIIYLAVSLCIFTSASFGANPRPLINTASFQSDNLNTPLVTAIWKGDIGIVKKIIEYGADVNEWSSGMSPLMFAARYNKVEIIKLLISSGAHINEKESHGFNALKFAELSNAHEAVALLKKYR